MGAQLKGFVMQGGSCYLATASMAIPGLLTAPEEKLQLQIPHITRTVLFPLCKQINSESVTPCSRYIVVNLVISLLLQLLGNPVLLILQLQLTCLEMTGNLGLSFTTGNISLRCDLNLAHSGIKALYQFVTGSKCDSDNTTIMIA